jgi:hypothetical protein
MKPDYDVKPKHGENLYKCICNGEDVGLRVWGQRASHAEEKLMEIFRLDLNGKEVDYDLEAYRRNKKNKPEEHEEEKAEAEENSCPLLPGME